MDHQGLVSTLLESNTHDYTTYEFKENANTTQQVHTDVNSTSILQDNNGVLPALYPTLLLKP
jgi:hypothetical protein